MVKFGRHVLFFAQGRPAAYLVPYSELRDTVVLAASFNVFELEEANARFRAEWRAALARATAQHVGAVRAVRALPTRPLLLSTTGPS